ncbi:methyltransferase like 4 [Cochliomyia hominivorax]
MQNIIIDNKICMFLNHQQLIKELYWEHSDNNNKYSLKSQLFNFKPKPNIKTTESNLNSKQLKKFNRKSKAETKNENTLKEKLQLQLQLYLQEIQQKYLLPTETLEDLPRYWEEQHEFPQFRGANLTNEFQITKFNHHEYIIPPQTKFFNYHIEELGKLLPELELYDLIIMDMPWQNKYIKRLKKVKHSLAYQMLDNETLKTIPIPQLIHKNSLVALWCTNALQHKQAIKEEFLETWNLKLLHSLKWFKLNTLGELISSPKAEGHKQPYELLYIACHKDRDSMDLEELKKVEFLCSIPSIIHSHKPPLGEWLKKYIGCEGESFKGLEIFARYLQPQFTSIGLEVLKLMDRRLYDGRD